MYELLDCEHTAAIYQQRMVLLNVKITMRGGEHKWEYCKAIYPTSDEEGEQTHTHTQM